MLFIFSLTTLLLYHSTTVLWAQQPAPVYFSLKTSPHQFDLFANGGWDGNWYVGYNSMWIVELAPVAQQADFARAYIGAKLGRAKSQAIPNKPSWIRAAIPCDLFIGIASTPAWKSSDSYYLAACEDLPLESMPEEALYGIGESRWFWKEIPLHKINLNGKNYLAIWSTTPEIIATSSGPILAAGRAANLGRAWFNRSISGSPPIKPEDSLETSLNEFVPALAIKLVPVHQAVEMRVKLVNFREGPEAYLWEVQVTAVNLEKIRPEMSVDGNHWVAFGLPLLQPPHQVVVSRARIKKEVGLLVPGNKKVDQAFIRITAWDQWGNSGSTDNFMVYVNR